MLGQIIKSFMDPSAKKDTLGAPSVPTANGPPGRNYTNGGPPGNTYGTKPVNNSLVSNKTSTNNNNNSSSSNNNNNNEQPAAQVPEGPSASDTLASISRDELANYLGVYGGTEEELLADTNSTKMIDDAKSSQALGQQVSAGMQQRSLSRYGANMTGAQKASQQRMNSVGNAASFTGAVNNSVLDQRDRNLGLKASLLGMGKEQLGVAMGGLGSAAGMEASRESQYQRDKAAAHASNMQTIGQIIGFGIG
tara:strand:- start:198 stop:947 length:750 start_codon:yes stop_codon:yes gene_type:complete